MQESPEECRSSATGSKASARNGPELENLARTRPYVNEVLTYDWNSIGRLWRFERIKRAFLLGVRALWRRWFDLALFPRRDADFYHASILAFFSGARARAAYSEHAPPLKQERNRRYDRLFTQVFTNAPGKHEVEYNLDALRFLGIPVKESRLELWLTKEDRDRAQALLPPLSRDGIRIGVGVGKAIAVRPVTR